VTRVRRDVSVTVRGEGFPSQTRFNVYLYPYGDKPEDADLVDTFRTGNWHEITETFDIPAHLQGVRRISVLLTSNRTGDEVYTWFYNTTARDNQDGGGSTGVFTFTITGVQRDEEVTLRMRNLPARQDFRVLMDVMGSQAEDGYVVGRFNSGTGGALTATYEIPRALRGESRIAVRVESRDTGRFYYNWFNNRTGSSGGSTGGSRAATAPIVIQSVVKDETVYISIDALPANGTYTFYMTTTGANRPKGTQVYSTSTKKLTAFARPLQIPAELRGQERLVLYVVSSDGDFYAEVTFNNRNK
jgi:hypothetical protein